MYDNINIEQFKKEVKLLQDAVNKLRRRQIFLEKRMEKIDGIKFLEPEHVYFDNGLPIA